MTTYPSEHQVSLAVTSKGNLRLTALVTVFNAWGWPEGTRFRMQWKPDHCLMFRVMAPTGFIKSKPKIAKGIATVRRDKPGHNYYRFYLPEPGDKHHFKELEAHLDTATILDAHTIKIPYPPGFKLASAMKAYEGLS